MKHFVLLSILFSIPSFALTPPQGKSMRKDGNYQSIDVPVGSFMNSIPELPRQVETQTFKPEVVQRVIRPKIKQKREVLDDRDEASVNKRTDHTNLPGYYQNIDRSDFKASDSVVYVASRGAVKLKGMRSGDIIRAVIEQEIKVSPSVPTPVRAIAISSDYKGSYFLGEATLDTELKRVLLNFNKLRLPQIEQVYRLRAAGLSTRGSVGLEGEYSSQAGKFFMAELASAAIAGWVDSTINRQQNSFGGYVQEPSLANSAKQGLTSAMSKSAERNAESARLAPEYTEVSGFQEVLILLQDDPVEAE